MVSAGGKLFYYFDEGLFGITDQRIPERCSLVCRDAFNGRELWRRPLKAWGWREWAADKFGSEVIVVAVDAKRRSRDAKDGWELMSHAGRKDTGLDAVEWATKMADDGAGQVLLTSMDRDGSPANANGGMSGSPAANMMPERARPR